MVELLLVTGIVAVIALAALPSLLGRKGKSDLENTTQSIAALLREAQSRSVTQTSSAAWGVYFENSTTSPSRPFFALFHTSTSTVIRRDVLPSTLEYATSNIAGGSSLQVAFDQLTGFASSSISLVVRLKNNRTVSSTISVAVSGLVTAEY